MTRRLVKLAAAAAGALAVAGSADATTLQWANGNSTLHGAPGGALVISLGQFRVVNSCDEGIDDVFQSFTTVYVVPSGSAAAGAELDDVTGAPNPIQGASGGVFIDEFIGAAPTGGTYDVVYDECQDGKLGAEDSVFPGAIVLESAGGVTPKISFGSIKFAAGTQANHWSLLAEPLKAYLKLKGLYEDLECFSSPVDCAIGEIADALEEAMFGPLGLRDIKQHAYEVILNNYAHYRAIEADPPDPDFTTLALLGPVAEVEALSSGPADRAAAALVAGAAQEGALGEALLHALERYQGAQAAGDEEWALVQARSIANLADALEQQLASSEQAATRFETALDGEPSLATMASNVSTVVARFRVRGATPGERRRLRNLGLTDRQIHALVKTIAESPVPGFSQSALRSHVAALRGAAAAARPHVAVLHADAAAAAAELTLAGFDDRLPRADAGGPYAARQGELLTLDGTGSAEVVRYRWDLDGDGAFDDAAGDRPSVTFPRAFEGTIALEAADATGAAWVDYAHIDVAATNGPPVIVSTTPPGGRADVVVGGSVELSLSAQDPQGQPLAISWSVNGVAAGTGATFTYAPGAVDVGPRLVRATVTDGPHDVSTAWVVAVFAPDEDGDGWTRTTDCDDADAGAYPGAPEKLGDGVDQDCDPGTADAPSGGLTGTVWSWGSNELGAMGTGDALNQIFYEPHEIRGRDDVVTLAGALQAGFSRQADDTVLSWGYNSGGLLGTGTTMNLSAVPTATAAVGGGPGPLPGIVELGAGRSHVLARRSDGSVVAWGTATLGELGDGGAATSRNYALPVVEADGTQLTGAIDVEAGVQDSYALMPDGSVRAWGTLRCAGAFPVGQQHPTPLTLLGTGVRQVAAGGQWALFLKRDGTVLSCGRASAPLLGRPLGPGFGAFEPRVVEPFRAGSGIVDVSAGIDGGIALGGDGTVWQWGTGGNGSLSPFFGTTLGGIVATPREVPLPSGPQIVDVEMDDAANVLALRADGSLLTWGANWKGQAGVGTTAAAVEPSVVQLPGRYAIGIANSTWNSLVLTRPRADGGWERPASWVTAELEDGAGTEAQGADLVVRLSEALPFPVTLDWESSSGMTGAVTVAAGSETGTLHLAVEDDRLDEEDEEIAVTVTDSSRGVQLGRAQAVARIADDDEAPEVSVESAAVVEGDTTLTDATLAVRLSAPSGKDVHVTYSTSDGTAGAPDDYAAAAGPVTIPAGETGALIHVAVSGDRSVEPDETLTVGLSAPGNATLAGGAATLTVQDDEPLVIGVTGATVLEGTGGSTTATFRVTVEPSPPPGVEVLVPYSIRPITAAVPDDLADASGTLRFAAGRAAHDVPVEIVADREVEPIETYRLVTGTATATGSRSLIQGDLPLALILDDDHAPVATDDAVTTDEDTPLEITFAATDAGGDELTYEVLSGPAHGTLVDRTYLPAENYHGPDSVRFRVSDGHSFDEGVVSITVSPVNDPPACLARSAETRQDTAVDVAPSCTDVEDSSFGYQIAAQGTKGVASVVGGRLHYLPNAGATGADVFRYRGLDSEGGFGEAPVAITITPVQKPNDPPLCASAGFSTVAGVAFSSRVTCADADGDTLAYSLVGGPSTGTLALRPDGTFTYTPASGFTGTTFFRFKAEDGQGGAAEAVASIAVTPAGDVTPPTCGFSTRGTNALGQTLIRTSVRDTGSGLASIRVLQSVNVSIDMPSFPVGKRNTLDIWSTQIDRNKPTIVEFEVRDVAGNTTTCDPVFTTLRITRTVRGTVEPRAQTFLGLPQNESKLVVRNRRPGLERLDVIVNGRRYRLRLRPGQTRRLDFHQAMKPGRVNTVTIRGHGRPGARADVVIADRWV